MQFVTLLVYYITVLSVAHALVVPIKHVQVHDLISHIPRDMGYRHRFLRGQLLETVNDMSTGLVSDIGDPGHAITSIPAPDYSSTAPQQSVTSSQSLTPTSSASMTATTSPQTSTIAVSPPTGGASPTTSSNTNKPQASASSIPIPHDDDGSRKYVVAHHMVGNTYPYTIDDWTDDIALAHASGIDGFALNCGSDEWEPARVADAYEAAKRSRLDFKLFISLDMTSFPCGSPDDARHLREFVKPYFNHPNQLQYDSRAFVSTFAGETCTFGQANAAEGWKSQFIQQSDMRGKVCFVPAFFVDPARFSDFSGVMDGDFNWNSGWPIQVTTSFAQDLVASLPVDPTNKNPAKDTTVRIANVAFDPTTLTSLTSAIPVIEPELSKFIGSTETDDEHLKGLETLRGAVRGRDDEAQKPIYMGAVSPWFFTHYGKDSFNKNWIFLSDDHLYAKRWESIIGSRDQFDIIQVLSWNDYGESHYVGPIKGSQPNSEAWVNGFEHTGWLELTQYYATAYKTGAFPTIEKEKIFIWSRAHPSEAKVVNDPVGQPDNFELSQDAIWAIVMTTAPSTVILSTSSNNAQQFQVPAGVSKLSVPITPGGTMKGVIQRDGKTVVELAPKPEEFTFQGSPTAYNFNAFVASATAE